MIWESRYGNASKDDGVYYIGSISKSFVSVLVLMLEQEGVISLSDAIANYTDDFDQEDYFKEYGQDELINMGMSHSAFLKQGEFIYSNTNILIVRQMIEKATDQDCEALIKEKILAPVVLKNTYFSDYKKTNQIISGYSNTNTAYKVDSTETTTSWSDVACGMYSTAVDMAKWGNFLMNSSLISEDSRKKLFAFSDTGKGFDFGLCVVQKQINKKTVTILQGNVPGYSSVVYFFDNTVLSVLCNLSDYSGRSISFAEETAKAIMTEVIQ